MIVLSPHCLERCVLGCVCLPPWQGLRIQSPEVISDLWSNHSNTAETAMIAVSQVQ